MENQDQPAEETPRKEIRVVRVESNKNFLVGQIYNLSSDVTQARVNLQKREERKIELAEKLGEAEALKEEEGQEGYKRKQEIKDIEKEIDVNDGELKSFEDILENKEELCQRYQKELDEAVEYEFPRTK